MHDIGRDREATLELPSVRDVDKHLENTIIGV
jgi:hypothetical protein